MRSKCRCSMCPAIHINSRSWLRSSSTHEPSDPPLKVVFVFANSQAQSSAHQRRLPAAPRSKLAFVQPQVSYAIGNEKKARGGGELLRTRKLFEPSPALAPILARQRESPAGCVRRGGRLPHSSVGPALPSEPRRREIQEIHPTAPLGQVPPVSVRQRTGRVKTSRPGGQLSQVFRMQGVRCYHNKPIMILPQVHLRKPCYDFYFL